MKPLCYIHIFALYVRKLDYSPLTWCSDNKSLRGNYLYAKQWGISNWILTYSDFIGITIVKMCNYTVHKIQHCLFLYLFSEASLIKCIFGKTISDIVVLIMRFWTVFHDDAIKWKHFTHYWRFCEGNPPVTGGLPSQRPMTRSFDVFFDLRLKKRLNKQSRRWGFETSLHS